MMISLNCETDFVAKNADFIALGYTILDAALKTAPADLEALKNTELEGKKVADLVLEKSGITGEKFELSYFSSVSVKQFRHTYTRETSWLHWSVSARPELMFRFTRMWPCR
jgi:elongation factor Ts